MDKNDDKIIRLQRVLGRTPKGRVLDPDGDAMKFLQDWRDLDTGQRRVECNNCGLIFFENYFVNGCPNCHAREPNDLGG